MKKSKRIALLAILLAIFIVVLDGTVMNVSMLQIAKDLNIGIQQMQSLITFYSLTIGALTLIAGKLADLKGHKKLFVIGISLFIGGSIISAFSPNYLTLFIGWSIIEGIGAALLMPSSVALIANTFKGKEQRLAFALWGAIAAIGGALGPLIGGYITTYYTWRLAFLMQIVAGILALWGSHHLPPDKLKDSTTELDYIGALLSSAGIILLILGFLKAPQYGWITPKNTPKLIGLELSIAGLSTTALLIILGTLCLSLFIMYEIKANNPLIDMYIFKIRAFSTALVLNLILNLAQSSLFFLLPLYMQIVLNLDPITTGQYLLPLTIGVFVITPVASRLKFQNKTIISVGILTSIGGFLLIVNAMTLNPTYFSLAKALFVIGTGLGLVISRITNVIMTSVPSYLTGQAAGINSTLRRVGASLGTALMGTIFMNHLQEDLSQAPVINSFSHLDIRIIHQIVTQTYPQLLPNLNTLIITAVQNALKWGIGFLILAFLWSLFLPQSKS